MNVSDIQNLIDFAVKEDCGKDVTVTVIKKQSHAWYFRFVVNTPKDTNKFINPLHKVTFGTVECTWHFTAFNCHLLDSNVEQFVEYYQAKKEGREI